MPATGGAASGTFFIMAVSLFSGLIAGALDLLSGLSEHLNPTTASLLGTVVVGVFGVLVREGVGLAKWVVERRATSRVLRGAKPRKR